MTRSILCAAILLSLFAGSSSAEVALPRIFGDHMVLQRDAKIAVWGKADSSEQVTVSIAGQTKPTNADESGKWIIWLDPIASQQPLTMTVTGKNTITIADILIGEVWVCSGQSNMEWPVKSSKDPEAEAAAANWPKIRFFNVSPKKRTAREPAWDVDAEWAVCSPQTAEDFSAVGYYFGRHLHQKLDGVPIGLINVSWGGVPAEAFTPYATIAGDAAFASIIEAYAAAVAKYPETFAEYEKKLAAFEEAKKSAEANGTKSPNRPLLPFGPDSPHAPGTLWNGMICPIVPFSMRGVIWYQGESNAGSLERAMQYRKLLPAMVVDWRKAWGSGDFPFLIVQLANYRNAATQPAEPNSGWALLREAQTMTVETVPNTAQAVTIDIGEAKDIHPKNKQEVGRRLGLAAEKIAYGRDVVHCGPVFKSMKVEGKKAVLTFDHIGGGLTARDDKLEGFAVRGADGEWRTGDAVIFGDHVIVTSAEVSAPVAVRYSWANNPRATLYNKEGLPAVPFRTDVSLSPEGRGPG